MIDIPIHFLKSCWMRQQYNDSDLVKSFRSTIKQQSQQDPDSSNNNDEVVSEDDKVEDKQEDRHTSQPCQEVDLQDTPNALSPSAFNQSLINSNGDIEGSPLRSVADITCFFLDNPNLLFHILEQVTKPTASSSRGGDNALVDVWPTESRKQTVQ